MQTGGPKLGSGQRRKPKELVRSEHIRFTLRQQELRDLRTIAEAWQIPLGTVCWAIVHTELQKCRKLAPNLGPVELGLQAAIRVLGRRAASAQSDAP